MMKYFYLLLLTVFCLLMNAQNTVTIQGDFDSGSTTDVYLNCDQSIRTIEVEVRDGSNNLVANETVTATIASSTSGTASFTAGSTTSVDTDVSGIATFDNLAIDENTDVTIQFEDETTPTPISATTQTINSAINCVTEIWTNYDGFWRSSSTSPNNGDGTLPDDSHELLAFRFNGTIYSTGVDDQKLTDNSVSFTANTWRALPVVSLPPGGWPNLIGFGQLADGINDGIDVTTSTNPDQPLDDGATLTGAEVASFLTDGIQGLDLGTNVSNIVGGTPAKFNLSSAGITEANVDDGKPDILISQTAQPTSGNEDELKFVKSDGITVVGIPVTLDITNEPVVGNWVVDFFKMDGSAIGSDPDDFDQPEQFKNTQRPIHFFAIDIADFGITTGAGGNFGDAAALIYTPQGSSDPSFIAFNEPSLGVASQLAITAQPTVQNCDGTLPSNITVRLEDKNDLPVKQDGITITASLETGPGDFTAASTITQLTNTNGVATFDDLAFTVGAPHKISFSFANLDVAITTEIGNATTCVDTQWIGAGLNSNWYNPDNWLNGNIPDGNNVVNIPNNYDDGLGGGPQPITNWPILEADAGAGDLTMESGASITLAGKELALNGSLNITTGAQIDASATGSRLWMSHSVAQTIPADLLSTNVANFYVENVGGVTVNSVMNITEELDIKGGTLNTNGNVTMKCFFDNQPNSGDKRRTAEIDELFGTINGNVTVEQCYPGRRAFRFVSASTTGGTIHEHWQENAQLTLGGYQHDPKSGYGTHITGVSPDPNVDANPDKSQDQVNGLDWQPSGNPSLFTFNKTDQDWDPVLDTNGTTLNAGDPYLMMIRGSRAVDLTSNTSATDNTILSSTGTVAQGDVTVTPGIGNNEFAFIGNPYHTAVNINKVLAPNSNYTDFIYVFDPNLGGTDEDNQNSGGTLGGRGGYVTLDYHKNTTSIQTSTGVTVTETNILLQPYQAFFVQGAPSPFTPNDITFKESYKQNEEIQTDVFSTEPQPHIFINLFDEESFNNLSSPDDGVVIYFSSKSSNAIDANDAAKFLNSDENLARIQDGNLTSYENRALPEDGEVLELYTDQYRTTNYKLEIGVFDFPNNDVFLYDHYTETEVAINNDDNYIYSFTVDQSSPESIATDRFEIRFGNTTLGINDFDQAGISIYPNPVQDKVTLNLSQFNEMAKQLSVYDITGKLINNYNIDNQENYEINMSNYASGVYILKIQTASGQLQHKLIKE